MCDNTQAHPRLPWRREGQVQSPNCINNHYTLETEYCYIAWLLYEV